MVAHAGLTRLSLSMHAHCLIYTSLPSQTNLHDQHFNQSYTVDRIWGLIEVLYSTAERALHMDTMSTSLDYGFMEKKL